jgi:hypothetical protein
MPGRLKAFLSKLKNLLRVLRQLPSRVAALELEVRELRRLQSHFQLVDSKLTLLLEQSKKNRENS